MRCRLLDMMYGTGSYLHKTCIQPSWKRGELAEKKGSAGVQECGEGRGMDMIVTVVEVFEIITNKKKYFH